MDPKFVLPKITVEEEESNGRDDQHVYYRVLKDGEPVSGWIEWSEARKIVREERRRVESEDPLRPEERRVLEIADELAAVQARLDEARRKAASTCRHPSTWVVENMMSSDYEHCHICCASRVLDKQKESGPWLRYYETPQEMDWAQGARDRRALEREQERGK